MRITTVLIALFLMVGSAYAADPENVLVEYDVYGGYGMAVLDAIDDLWPDADVESYNGNWTGFISALTGSTDWDVVVCEAHNYTSFTTSHFQAMADWYDDEDGPLFYADWAMHYGYSTTLYNAMGVSSTVNIYMPPQPHYIWDEDHPIFDGVDDLTYGDPGYGTGGQRFTVDDAVPISGWTSSETSGQAGLCIANDGYSVICGIFPSLVLEDPEYLWTNILTFMWAPLTGVQPASLGQIKAMYQ